MGRRVLPTLRASASGRSESRAFAPATPTSTRAFWKPSRFNLSALGDDGSLLIYNAYMGAFARVPPEEAQAVAAMLDAESLPFPSGPLAELALNGFIVPADKDELGAADRLHRDVESENKALQLILMPNENCNFRCRYCYETFARNKMERRVIEGIVSHVEARAKELTLLRIGWFGGEPLTALDIVDEISTRLQRVCRENDVWYASSMTTNGYLLTTRAINTLFRAEVRRFQITLDGEKEDHDRLRVLLDGHTGTYDRILANLKSMRGLDELFRVVVRVNFHPDNLPRMDRFIRTLKNDLGDDGRFSLDFHPVGRWGGPNDERLHVCGREDGQVWAVDLHRRAAAEGFDLVSLRQRVQPLGSACYAANPQSFVIGADGTVYKCTVAFQDHRNQVGTLTESGELLLEPKKMVLWTSQGEERDASCRACSFRPACQGNACPLERLNTDGAAPCPSLKTRMGATLRVLAWEGWERQRGNFCLTDNRRKGGDHG